MLYKFSCLPSWGEDAHSPDHSRSEWLRRQRDFVLALLSQARTGMCCLHCTQAVPRGHGGFAWLSHPQCVCVCTWAHTCVPKPVDGQPALPDSLLSRDELASQGAPGCWNPVLTLKEFWRCQVRGLAPNATTQIRPQVTVVRQWNHLFFWFWWLLFLTVLNGQEEPEGKVAKAA